MKNIFPPKRIVAAVDMSKPSLAAVAAATSLAKTFGSKLELVYVQELPLSLLGFETEGGAGELAAQMEDFRQWREERLRGLAAGLPAARVRARVLRGSPALVLAQLARPSTADLIVMGTHGHSGFERAAFGSVAEAVVRRSQVPVLTLRDGGFAPKPARILAPFNLRDYAEPALDCAAQWARKLHAALTVLYVGGEAQWSGAARERLARRLGPLLGGARLSLVQRSGEPRGEIVREAAQGGYDLIVLAAHRKPFGGGMILGSTAERVLRHAPAPVLSVPSSEKSEAKALGGALAGKIYGWP